MKLFFCLTGILCLLFGCKTVDVNSTVLFEGDSHIRRWDLNIYFPGVNIDNTGQGGATITEITTSLLENERLPFYETIFVEAGTNDIRQGLRSELSDEEILLSFSEAFEVLSEQLLVANIKANILSLPAPGSDSLGERANLLYPEANSIIKQICNDNINLTFLSIFEVTSTPSGYLKSHFTLDLLHLNEAGYYEVSKEISDYVY